MESLLQETAAYISLTIQAIAILVIVAGVVEAVFGIVRLLFGRHVTESESVPSG